jgi:signal transduction histidine kinase
METELLRKQLMRLRGKLGKLLLSVPVRLKIGGIMVIPVLILGLVLTYWIRTGLSDWLSYLMTDERVRVAMQAGSRSVVFVTIVAAVISVLLTFLLMLMLTRPLLELRRVAHQVTAGDYSPRATVWAQDEIGDVAHAVNTMIDGLVLSQETLSRTNRRLEAINRVVMATSREVALPDVLNASLETTLDVMGLQGGWILLRDPGEPGDERFRLASQIGIDENVIARLENADAELCACQRALLSGELGQTAAMQPCRRLGTANRDAGSRDAHITIPLDVREQRYGVLNLVCPLNRLPSADEIDLLSAIGAHLSEIVSNAQLHASLVEKEAVRQALLEALVRAQEDERARLARELHDGAGQTLTSLLVRLKLLEKRVTGDGIRRDVTELCQTVSETVKQIREVSTWLRPSALAEFGLEIALRTLVQEMSEGGDLTAECRLELGERRFPFEIESTLYRIAQESLTNVVRHADACRVQVELVGLPYAICLRVEDDGIGFDAEAVANKGERPRLGLIGMQERAEMLGGSLVVRSALGAGTSVEVRIPVETEGVA